MSQDKKNTLNTPQSTKPFSPKVPFTPPFQNNFKKPSFNGPKFNSSFRTQNRGGGGK